MEVAIIGAAFVAGMIAIVLVERAFHRSGRQGIHFRHWDSSTAKLTRAATQPSPEETAAMLRQFERLESIRRSPRTRVIGVGATLEDDGITVEFLSVELRGAGGRATYRVHANAPYRGGADPETRWRLPPQPIVVDDLGTAYATGMSAWGGGGGSQDDSESVVDFAFAPAPPATARSLRVSVPYLDPAGGPPELKHAPWVFDVPL